MVQDRIDEPIAATLRRSAAALREAGVPFMLGGSLACWARGGPEPHNDVDFMVPPAEAHAALQALVSVGLRPEDPPEEWLLKAWDGDIMVDLIHQSTGIGEITPETIRGAERMSVLAIRMPVMASEDVLVAKLMAISEQQLDYAPLLAIARALRESIDWPGVRVRTESSPYARAFFALLAELDVLDLVPPSWEEPASRAPGRARR